jgi:hypothetical protein
MIVYRVEDPAPAYVPFEADTLTGILSYHLLHTGKYFKRKCELCGLSCMENLSYNFKIT